jgi:hypothetical protein
MIKQPKIICLQTRPGSWRVTGANGNDQHVVDPGLPVDCIGRGGCHVEGQESRVVVCCDPAIHKDKSIFFVCAFGKDDDLWWKECGCRRAGTHQLPERKVEVAIDPFPIVVVGCGIVAHRPRRVSRMVTHYNHKQRT